MYVFYRLIKRKDVSTYCPACHTFHSKTSILSAFARYLLSRHCLVRGGLASYDILGCTSVRLYSTLRGSQAFCVASINVQLLAMALYSALSGAHTL